MIYGYARVSTNGQAMYGNGLEEQIEKLEKSGCQKVYKDTYTGKKISRPEFDNLLKIVEDGDTIVVTKLDRISRTAEEGGLLIKELLNRGVNVHILNMGLIENTPLGMLMMHMLLAFAEFERDLILERTQAGREVARQREGYREGRPMKELPNAEEWKEKVARGEITVTEACREMGISRRTWYTRVAA